MENYLAVEIYRDNNPQSARTIRVSMHNGLLSMELHDVGPLVERFCGDSDYERSLFNINVNDVKKALGIEDDHAIIAAIKVKFGVNSGFNQFTEFLNEKGIAYQLASY
ncbi:MAG: hypothetical protein K2L05_06295 [Muribaculaceae bacterium]|nr:hypothetical protein [Muribaculaceae bacterium]